MAFLPPYLFFYIFDEDINSSRQLDHFVEYIFNFMQTTSLKLRRPDVKDQAVKGASVSV